MRDILFFDNMLTPKIITFVYWLMLVGIVVGGFSTMFMGRTSASGMFMGLVAMVGGAIGARIFCELMIVAFKMNEALQDIRPKQ